MRRLLDLRSAWVAAGWYLALACLMTWPLIAGIACDIPGDLGDSVLNGWILSWTGDRMLALLRGDLSALATYWHTNAFAPEPYTLAYSEHLTALTLQILPIYAVTGNVVLCYNLLFLSQIALAGLGVYLLVRHLTSQALAAFVAGLLYAFAPYRVAQMPHLQVLAAQWMPFVLYGFRVYFETGSRRALVWGTLALVAQNLSCGYYLFFFAPLVVAYVLYELADRGRLRDAAAWRDLALAAAATAAATLPFLVPYVRLKAHLYFVRSLAEVVSFSADVHSYATPSEALHLWGGIDAFRKAEGELFPGLTLVLLALAGTLLIARAAWVHAGRDAARPRWRGALTTLVGLVALCQAGAIALLLVHRRLLWNLGPIDISLRDGHRTLAGLAIAAVGWLALSPRARRVLRGVPGSMGGFLLAGAVTTTWLSFGPIVQSLGRPVAIPALYLPLYLYVPGFDGLRTPARFGMLTFLLLAIVAGYALAWLAVGGRAARALVVVCGVVVLFEGHALPLPMNRIDAESGLATPGLLDPAPAIYARYAELRADAVVLELPVGSPGYDLRSMYYSRLHGRRIVNGYSGMFPAWYGPIVGALEQVASDPGTAWKTLRGTPATHVMVREGAYLNGEGVRLEQWLEGHGARRIARAGPDALYALPAREGRE